MKYFELFKKLIKEYLCERIKEDQFTKLNLNLADFRKSPVCNHRMSSGRVIVSHHHAL